MSDASGTARWGNCVDICIWVMFDTAAKVGVFAPCVNYTDDAPSVSAGSDDMVIMMLSCIGRGVDGDNSV